MFLHLLDCWRVHMLLCFCPKHRSSHHFEAFLVVKLSLVWKSPTTGVFSGYLPCRAQSWELEQDNKAHLCPHHPRNFLGFSLIWLDWELFKNAGFFFCITLILGMHAVTEQKGRMIVHAHTHLHGKSTWVLKTFDYYPCCSLLPEISLKQCRKETIFFCCLQVTSSGLLSKNTQHRICDRNLQHKLPSG